MTEAARPQLWLLLGGNGAGKTTFYNLMLAPRGVLFVNADRIAKELSPTDPENASYAAARTADVLREELLRERVSFCFETVFSHPSKIDFVGAAKAAGYEIILVYIHLLSDQLNIARVQQRISEGGHAVPHEKIIERIPRTLANVKNVLPLADRVELLDNSSRDDPYRRMASVQNGHVKTLADPLPAWAAMLLE
ncbi:MAG: zeta toxin family protein [Spongiibacteraceae bacterium]